MIGVVADIRAQLMLEADNVRLIIRLVEVSKDSHLRKTRAQIGSTSLDSLSSQVRGKCCHLLFQGKISFRTSLILTMRSPQSWALKIPSIFRQTLMGKVSTLWVPMRTRFRVSDKIPNSTLRSLNQLIATDNRPMPNSSKFFWNQALVYPSVNSLGYLYIEPR